VATDPRSALTNHDRVNESGLRMLTPIDADVEAKPQTDKALMSEIPLNRLVKVAGKDFVGEQREFYLLEEWPGEGSSCERLLGDAMIGDGALFTHEDAVAVALRNTTAFAHTDSVAGDLRRPTQSLLQTVHGRTPSPRKRLPEEAFAMIVRNHIPGKRTYCG